MKGERLISWRLLPTLLYIDLGTLLASQHSSRCQDCSLLDGVGSLVYLLQSYPFNRKWYHQKAPNLLLV